MPKMPVKFPYEIANDEHRVGQILIAKGNWTDECTARMNTGDLNGVRLSYSAGFRGTDVSFLALFPHLSSVEIYVPEVMDLQPLASLTELKVLGLQTESKTQLNGLWFPQLRIAKIQWRKGMEGLLEATQLEYLNCVNYPFPDLAPLAALIKLERLSLTSRKLESIVAIEKFPLMRQLDLYACPNLISIDPALHCSNIINIEVESCRHIPNRP